jgi:uncharacterized membrane protein
MQTLPDTIERAQQVDPAAERLARIAQAAVPEGPVRDALRGEWLGHPLHPALTDLPIGFWTSASVLDLMGGKQARSAARVMVALGVASTVPTVAAGLAELTAIDDDRTRRVALVHAAANATATLLYARSWLARRRGRHAAGVALALTGACVATVGGYLGGHLAFGSPDSKDESQLHREEVER